MKYTPYFLFLFCLVFLFALSPVSCAQEPMAPIAGIEEGETPKVPAPAKDGQWTNIIYFTGVGCPHCAKTDPVVLKDRLRKGDMMVFEYEIYRDNVNGPLLMEYNKAYGARLAVPQIIAGTNAQTGIVSGDAPLLGSLETVVKLHEGNGVVLSSGEVSFDDLSLIKLPYKPKIWFKDRLAIREDSSSLQDEKIKAFLLGDGIPKECAPQKNADVPLSGGTITFKNACRFDGWVLMYD